LFANVLGLIGFSKCWFNVIFGGVDLDNKKLPMDLTIKEIFIITTCLFILVVTVFLSNFYF
jgi:hypothetical protein